MNLAEDTLNLLVESFAGLRCLRLRLHFQDDEGRELPRVDEQVWRGALKHHLPAQALHELFGAPADGEACGSGGATVPAIILEPGEGQLTMTLLGTGVGQALACTQALMGTAALHGLGRHARVAVLDRLCVVRGDGAWQAIDVPLRASQLDAFALRLGELCQGIGSDWGHSDDTIIDFVALHFLTPCVLPKARQLGDAPPLESFLRSLIPRIVQLIETRGEPEALRLLDPARRQAAILSLPAMPAHPASRGRWESGTVKSGRQKTRYASEGILGLLLYAGVPRVVVDLLRLGQVVGIGQQTTIDRGRYVLLVGSALR